MLAGGINCLLALMFNATEGYGNHTLPVTFWVLDLIRGTLYLFVIVVVTFYAGALVWKDTDERMDEIVDATPVPELDLLCHAPVTLVVMVMLIQVFALLSGVVVQAWHGYYRFQIGLYSYELLVRDASCFLWPSQCSRFLSTQSPQTSIWLRYLYRFSHGNVFMWGPMNVATNLVQFAGAPSTSSTQICLAMRLIACHGHWYAFYWLLFCGLLAILTVMFWPRGKQDRWAWKATKCSATLSRRLDFRNTGLCLLAFVCNRQLDLVQH